ncbi:Metallo-dependent phosphatase-like protein [Mycena pura]|uniref:Metallo-dependent phosphatase-like protein n=1 Tax=Mycena pura TaxID=153505 RepID=A0AAD6V6X2_9AGAR|nr:Metallo-dependent phosphatase-like protein [Mycena pura]
MNWRLLLTLVFAGVAAGCSDEHAHAHVAKREFSQALLTPPTRPLQWGTLNIIHTTARFISPLHHRLNIYVDHRTAMACGFTEPSPQSSLTWILPGWLLGHQKPSFPEPNYSGDLGDFASFVAHMKEIALQKDVDLLLVDSGDLHDGTGLSDGFPPGGVDAHASNEFFKQLPYDVLAIGNHELYIYNNTLDMFKNFAPHFPGRYLTSNVNITVNGVSVPVGSRFAKFKTRKGRSVTALGVLYDFTDNDEGTTVQFVADMVKEAWFAGAIKEEPDLFLLVGHMPVARDNWPAVYNAVRAVHPFTPIIILGGHSHVRDCLQFDGRSIALESGRYMETVGWLSAELPFPKTQRESKHNITFSRRYLDPNRVTYEFHTVTGQRSSSFDTSQGRSITKGLEQLAKTFDLSFKFGVAPHDFYLSRAPYPSNDSVLSLMAAAMPVALTINNTRAGNPNIMITNSGELRFDIFGGPFTKNDQLTASPFMDSFLFIPDVPFAAANAVLPALNDRGAEEMRAALWASGRVETRYREWLEEMYRRDASHGGPGRRLASPKNLTLGYMCPGEGDDTPHTQLPFFSTPEYIGSVAPDVSDDTPVDLVFVNFIQSQLLRALNSVQTDNVYTAADVAPYTNVLSSEALGLYAQQIWNSS